jgi:SAM-dependent methyltransferase
MQDNRQFAPAAARNRQPILDVLLRVLPTDGDILEIASGTGEHAIFFAPHFRPRRWIPSDPNPQAIASITAWSQENSIDNLNSPLNINAQESDWFEQKDLSVNAIVCINMIHIAPWSACLGLMTGASQLLPNGGILYLYGPYKQGGKHTAPSNLDFDLSLRDRNPEWGVRDLDDVVNAASDRGLKLQELIPMPANNLSVVFVN